jgi:enamine deaminase RidA (YjgF/YER057c/UK114 family)
MLEARRERFGGRVPPSASVIVQALPDPDWLVEVDAIAVRRRP